MCFDIIPELSNPDKISCEHEENKACKALVVLDLSLRCLDHVDCVIILAYTFIFSFWMQTKMFLLLNQPPERFDNYLFCKLWCLRAGMLPRFDIRQSCRKKIFSFSIDSIDFLKQTNQYEMTSKEISLLWI